MQASGIEVSDEVTTAYADLKDKHLLKYLVFKISDDKKSIVVDVRGEKESDKSDKDIWKKLADDLVEAGEPRYIIFDFNIEKADGTGNDKLVFIYW